MKTSRKLSKAELAALLHDPTIRLDGELTKRFGMEVYVCPGKGVLFARTKVLWDKEALEKTLDSTDRAPSSVHILSGRFKHGADFIVHAPSIASQLAGILEISHDEFDFTPSSFHLIDRKLRSNPSLLDDTGVFAAVLAYFGEVRIRTDHRVAWDMRYAENLWEPWLVTSEGYEHPVFLTVYKAVVEGRYGSSLFRAYHCMFFTKKRDVGTGPISLASYEREDRGAPGSN